MHAMNYESLLQGLPPDELRRLHAKIASRLTEPVATTRQEEISPVYDAISRNLTVQGIRGIPWAVFQSSRDFKAFEDKAAWLTKFIRASFKPKNRIEFAYCANLVIKLLVAWMQDINIPLSYRTCINNLDRISVLVDDAFPGYRRAGLLNSIIQHTRA